MRSKLMVIKVSGCHLIPVICVAGANWRSSRRWRPSAPISASTNPDRIEVGGPDQPGDRAPGRIVVGGVEQHRPLGFLPDDRGH